MKKFFVFLLVFAFLFSFTSAPKNVNAFVEPPKPVFEAWEWYAEGVTGEETPITTAPREWYQLKSDGLKVNGATRICHGFDDGRYGWTGEIFRLVDGTWVKLPTTVGWVPTEEGHFMACATAPSAGTYALFGYFDKSKAPAKKSITECDSWDASVTHDWDPPTFYSDYVKFYYPGAAGDLATFSILNSNYLLTGDLTGTAYIDSSGIVNFEAYSWQTVDPSVNSISFTYRVVTPVCYFEWDVSIFNMPFN